MWTGPSPPPLSASNGLRPSNFDINVARAVFLRGTM